MTGKSNTQKSQNVFMENRESLTVTGVNDVDSFDDKVVCIGTELGQMIVKGVGLHIVTLSLDVGEVVVKGTVNLIEYTAKQKQKDEKILTQLFR